MTNDILSVKDLKKTYPKNSIFSKEKPVTALKGISFSAKQGEIFGILGPNGAGKSTAMNILADLLTSDSGSINIFGYDFFKNKEKIKENMSLINGYASYPTKLTVYENMKIYAKIYGVKDYNKRILELLELVGIPEKKNKKFSELSSGQRTRVNIVKGLIHSPKLVLMDEPTIGLDPHIALKIRKLIRKISKVENTTIIFTSHNMQEVEELCSRIALLKDGNILKTASPHELTDLVDAQVYEIDYSGNSKIVKNIFSSFETLNISITKEKIKFEATRNFELNDLLRSFVKNNINIVHINIKKPNLEHIFIEVAEGRL
ncbi:MAG: ABC transporter ATP-binding protein [Candidatus Woesearchaeota archaeon]